MTFNAAQRWLTKADCFYAVTHVSNKQKSQHRGLA